LGGEVWQQLLRLSSLGLTFLVLVAGAAFAGIWLDRIAGSAPWFAALGTSFGFASWLLILVREQGRMAALPIERRETREPRPYEDHPDKPA
jgi:F0F1-type ATP synthase assembly protein I